MLALAHADELFGGGGRALQRAALAAERGPGGHRAAPRRLRGARAHGARGQLFEAIGLAWRGPVPQHAGKRARTEQRMSKPAHYAGPVALVVCLAAVPPGDRIALRAAEDRLLLPRDRYKRSRMSRPSAARAIRTSRSFDFCELSCAGRNRRRRTPLGCAGAGTHRDATPGLRRGLRKNRPSGGTRCARARGAPRRPPETDAGGDGCDACTAAAAKVAWHDRCAAGCGRRSWQICLVAHVGRSAHGRGGVVTMRATTCDGELHKHRRGPPLARSGRARRGVHDLVVTRRFAHLSRALFEVLAHRRWKGEDFSKDGRSPAAGPPAFSARALSMA